MTSVLFVCMGNICRSPMAEGAFRHQISQAGLERAFEIDSAGTIGYHSGAAPDPRAQAAARAAGLDISNQRSRKITPTDFTDFDHILAMDDANLQDLRQLSPRGLSGKVQLFLPFGTLGLQHMPDPYYGIDEDFDHCMEAALDAAQGLLNHLHRESLTL